MNNLLCEGKLNGSMSQRIWGANRVGCRVETSGECLDKQSPSSCYSEIPPDPRMGLWLSQTSKNLISTVYDEPHVFWLQPARVGSCSTADSVTFEQVSYFSLHSSVSSSETCKKHNIIYS